MTGFRSQPRANSQQPIANSASSAAVIFDMDGMLTDSEPLWRIASVEALNAVGVPVSEADVVETTGLRTDELLEHWYSVYPWAEPPRKVVEGEIERRVIALIRERSVPNPGVHEILETLSAAGYPLAIASSSQSEVIQAVLETLGIASYFAVVQSAEHEPFGKPHPAVYIEAARALGVAPVACVAFEDSPNGVIAAKAARMRCVAVPDPALIDDRRFLAADLRLSSLTEFRLEMLSELSAIGYRLSALDASPEVSWESDIGGRKIEDGGRVSANSQKLIADSR